MYTLIGVRHHTYMYTLIGVRSRNFTHISLYFLSVQGSGLKFRFSVRDGVRIGGVQQRSAMRVAQATFPAILLANCMPNSLSSPVNGRAFVSIGFLGLVSQQPIDC